MKNMPKQLKGGYLGHQRQIVRFRVSDGLYDKLQELARQRGLCTAAVARKLVVAGLEKSDWGSL